MLLNRVLTVRPGEPASHRGKGWEQVTEHAIRTLVARDKPFVAILWGRDAGTLKPMLGCDAGDRVRASEPALRVPRILRFAAVLAGERAARAARRAAGRLESRSLIRRRGAFTWPKQGWRKLAWCLRRNTRRAANCRVTCASLRPQRRRSSIRSGMRSPADLPVGARDLQPLRRQQHRHLRRRRDDAARVEVEVRLPPEARTCRSSSRCRRAGRSSATRWSRRGSRSAPTGSRSRTRSTWAPHPPARASGPC